MAGQSNFGGFLRVFSTFAPHILVIAFVCTPILDAHLLAPLAPAAARADDGPAWPTKPKSPGAEPKKDDPATKPRVDPRRKPRDPQPAPPSETDKDRLKREAEGLFGTPGSPAAPGAAAPRGWTVVLGVFRGGERDSASRVFLDRVRTEGGFPDAVALSRNDAIIVSVGDFQNADQPEAQAALRRAQEMTLTSPTAGSVRPYSQAFLSPPSASEFTGNLPQYHLARAKELYGKDALYTLQVGVYARLDLANPKEADLKELRTSAEKAVYILRQEGELAFYYHSPTMSMVTIGVFGPEDFDPQVPNFMSQPLRDLKLRFPHNLYNGAPLKQRIRGGPETIQPSMLVEIPNK